MRNRLTSAALTATATLDGKLPADKSNLRDLVNALEDVKSIAATVSKYDWSSMGADDQVDVHEMIRAVAADFALVSSAADVRLIVAEPPAAGCGTLRGRASTIHGALEGAVHALVSALPAERISLAAVTGVDRRPVAGHVAELVPHLESRGGRVHVGDDLGEYSLHLPGKPLCAASAGGAFDPE